MKIFDMVLFLLGVRCQTFCCNTIYRMCPMHVDVKELPVFSDKLFSHSVLEILSSNN